MNKRVLFPLLQASLLIALLMPRLGHANFDEEKRSANLTAYTLPAGEFELGMTGTKFGITNQLQLEVGLLHLLAKTLDVGAAYEIALGNGLVIKPTGGVVVPATMDAVYGHGALFITKGFGERQQHHISIGGGARYAPVAELKDLWDDEDAPEIDIEVKVTPTYSLFYDYHTKNGNLLYVGMFGSIPTIGFTWAWEHFHFGLVTTPLALFIPLPYVYLRF